jgi:hypothetical protein
MKSWRIHYQDQLEQLEQETEHRQKEQTQGNVSFIILLSVHWCVLHCVIILIYSLYSCLYVCVRMTHLNSILSSDAELISKLEHMWKPINNRPFWRIDKTQQPM